MATIEQKIAQKEDELARLKAQSRKLENGQKIIMGGMYLSIARNNPQRTKTILNDITVNITKSADLKRMQPLIDELTLISNKYDQAQNKQQNPHSNHNESAH